MEQTPANHLQEAIKLAQQAAAQMKKAAKLAENAAQLWQQAQALALANQEDLSQPPVTVQMTVAAPQRKKTQRSTQENTRLRENAPFRNIPRLTPAPEPAEALVAARSEHGWEEGEDWWKPRQQTSDTER